MTSSNTIAEVKSVLRAVPLMAGIVNLPYKADRIIEPSAPHAAASVAVANPVKIVPSVEPINSNKGKMLTTTSLNNLKFFILDSNLDHYNRLHLEKKLIHLLKSMNLNIANKIKELSEYSKRKEEIAIDLMEEKIIFGNNEIKFDIDPFKKKCLLEGLDDIALSLAKKDKIMTFEENLKNTKPWIFND